jgi:hypothetical protein
VTFINTAASVIRYFWVINNKSMRINDLRTINELQKEFRQEFPYLRIEFFKDTRLGGKGTRKMTKLNTTEVVGNVREVHNRGYIKLDETLTVEGLEHTFLEVFGLHVNIFRKSFDKWIQSDSSDASTLRELNLRGLITDDESSTS